MKKLVSILIHCFEETKALDIWLHDTEAACMYANIFFLNMAGAQIKLPSSSSHSKTECDHRNIHNDCFKKIEVWVPGMTSVLVGFRTIQISSTDRWKFKQTFPLKLWFVAFSNIVFLLVNDTSRWKMLISSYNSYKNIVN